MHTRSLILLGVLAACAPVPTGADGCLESPSLCREAERCDEALDRCVPRDPQVDLAGSAEDAGNNPDLGPTPSGEGACSADNWCWAHPLPQGNRVSGIWAYDEKTAFAVAANELLRWNGQRWSVVAHARIGFSDVFGVDPQHVWAVGAVGGVAFWDDHALSARRLNTTSSLLGVWARDASHVWTVGGSSAFFWLDGMAWSGSGNGREIYDGISGFGKNLYLTQRRGPLLKWSGGPFESITPPPFSDPVGVWAQDEERVWVAGEGIYLYDGSNWSQKLSNGNSYSKIWGADSNHVWALGSSTPIMAWDGTTFRAQDPGTKSSLRSLGGVDARHVWAGADDGTIVHFDGMRWQPQVDGVPGAVRGLHGLAAGPLFAVCEGGVILRSDGGRFVREASPTPNSLNSVWVQSQSLAFAVGELGTILRWDGTNWQAMSSPSGDRLNSVWGSDATHAWAVSELGEVLSYNGTAWKLDRRSGTRLSTVWGLDGNRVWATAENGKLLALRGGGIDLDTKTGVRLHGLHGLDDKHLFAVGDNHTLVAYNGTTWQRLSLAESNLSLRAVYALDADNVLIVGDNGTALLGYRGVFSYQQLGYQGTLHHIFALPNHHAFIAGSGGAILTRAF